MKISQFFKDDTGQLSSARLGFLTWCLGVFGVWSYICISTKTLVPIPQTVVELTLIVMAGKVSSAWVDGKTPNPPAKPSE